MFVTVKVRGKCRKKQETMKMKQAEIKSGE